MNIFLVSNYAKESARMLADKHVVKMILESAQMLSTAHRILDGQKVGKAWVHPTLDDVLYKAAHINHPCTIWTREGRENYKWHYYHWAELCKEYTRRYGKIHVSETKLISVLFDPPQNIPDGSTTFRPALGRELEPGESVVEAYRDYYSKKSERMKLRWKSPGVQPDWFVSYETTQL